MSIRTLICKAGARRRLMGCSTCMRRGFRSLLLRIRFASGRMRESRVRSSSLRLLISTMTQVSSSRRSWSLHWIGSLSRCRILSLKGGGLMLSNRRRLILDISRRLRIMFTKWLGNRTPTCLTTISCDTSTLPLLGSWRIRVLY